MRGEVNKVMEQARKGDTIGSSLEAKVLLYVADDELRQRLQALNPESQPLAVSADEQPEVEEVDIPIQLTTKDASSQEWQRFLTDFSVVLSEWFENLGGFLQNNQKPLTVFSLIVAVALALYLVGATMDAINRLPLLEPLFIIVGFLYSLRFASGKLIQAADRQELFAEIESFKEEIVGKTSSRQTPIVQPAVSTQGTTEIQELTADLSPILEDSTLNQGVDELRYLFISSQVELLESPAALSGLDYKGQSDGLTVGVVKASGEKCDRCWNYSLYVGKSHEHPLLCDRCIPALA